MEKSNLYCKWVIFHSYVWPQSTRKKTWKTHFAKWHISMRVLPCQVSFWNGKNGLLLDVTWYHCSNGLLNSIKAWVREFLQKPMFFYASIVSSNVLHSPCLLWARPTLSHSISNSSDYPKSNVTLFKNIFRAIAPCASFWQNEGQFSTAIAVSIGRPAGHHCGSHRRQLAHSEKNLGFWHDMNTEHHKSVGSKKSLQPLWRTKDEGLLILLVWHGSLSCMEIWFVPLSLSRKAFLAVRLRSIKAFFNPMDFWLPLWISRMKPLHHP